MRGSHTLLMVLCALLFAGPAAAQDQRGGIQGVVKDSQAAVIPGVLVEAHSATGATASTTTDTNGSFRFPSLQPGIYEIDATIAGFKPGKITDVHVQLGEVRTVDFTLPVATVAETVNVTATSPVVDFTQSQRAVNIHAERIELLPHGRDFTTLVTQAPGANQEAKLGGLSIDGASAGENRYIVDGMETTNLQSGLSGKGLIADFVEEVQVKSSGYTAEYGGAMGGVINAVTKSGTNEFRGFGLFNWQGAKLAGGAGAPGATGNSGVPTLRISLTDQNASEYITYSQDQWNRYEPAIAIGGPIAVNKAWFWGAYQPVTTPMKRTVTLRATGSPISVDRKELVQNVSANQTSQISSGIRTRVSFNNSWNKADGLLPALNGTDVVGVNYTKASAFPNWTLSANADWVASPKVFVGLRGGYYNADQHDTNVTEQPQYSFPNTSNVGLAGVPADLQHPTGFLSIPSNQKVTKDQQTRAFFQADTTWYGTLGGQHQFKGGVQLDRLGNNVLRGNARPVVRLFWNTPLSSGTPVQRGTFGYYEVRSNGVDPTKGIITEGDVHSTNIGLFIQDAWTVASGLTINAGIRTEREQVPAYTTGPDIPDFGIKFSFKDKLAPRAGFAYDVKHDGKWKVSGSWGIFYDIFKLELPRGSFGGDKWLSYYYTLDTPNWPTLLDNKSCPPACPGTIIRGAPTAANPIGGIDFRHPSFGSDSIEPNLKPMRSQEAMLALDHEFTSVMAVSVRYVHKQLDRVVEDTGSLDADGNEIYIIANSGEGLTSLAYTNPSVPMPKPQRDYDSVEFAFDKRMSHNWYLRASYLWSRLYGNYTGLTQSDESGRTSPNVGRAYDYPLMMFTGDGQASYGLLPTDRPGQFKTQFIYSFPFGTSIGFNEYVASGLPVTREMAVLPGSNYPVQYLGRASDGRTPMYSQSDLYVQHEFKLTGGRRFQLNANIQNLFNQRTEISKFSTQQRSNGITFNEAAFYRGQVSFPALISAGSAAVTAGGPTFTDPRFLLANDYQSPIMVRLGVKLIF